MKKIERQEFLRLCARWSALAGLVGCGAALSTREQKFACNDRCGQCPKFEHGKCGEGLK